MNQRGVWDSIAEEWSRYRKKPFAEVKEIASSMSGLILDLGCGSGRNFLTDKKIVALDFSENMLRLAAKKQYCIFVQGDMSSLPFKENSFDNIIAVSAIQCTPGWKHALDECYRILKPCGRVMITVWDGEQDAFKKQIERGSSSIIYTKLSGISNIRNTSGFPIFEKEIIRKWGGYDRYYYLFSQKELENLVRKTGFNIIKSERFIGGHKELFWNLLVLAEKRP